MRYRSYNSDVHPHKDVYIAKDFKYFLDIRDFNYKATKEWALENNLKIILDWFVFNNNNFSEYEHTLCLNDEVLMVDFKLRFQ